jgi:hypothetical protein
VFNAKTAENFVPKEDVDFILNSISGVDRWESGGNEYWDNRCLNLHTITNSIDKKCGNLIESIIFSTKNYIEDQYKLDREVFPDTIQVVRWFPNMEQHPHADDMTNTEIKGFEHRVFASILYLNDNYSGGETYYPQYDISVKPSSGKLAIHPGDTNHIHGVSKIEGGMRYTIAAFWTYDRNKLYGWSIHQ